MSQGASLTFITFPTRSIQLPSVRSSVSSMTRGAEKQLSKLNQQTPNDTASSSTPAPAVTLQNTKYYSFFGHCFFPFPPAMPRGLSPAGHLIRYTLHFPFTCLELIYSSNHLRYTDKNHNWCHYVSLNRPGIFCVALLLRMGHPQHLLPTARSGKSSKSKSPLAVQSQCSESPRPPRHPPPAGLPDLLLGIDQHQKCCALAFGFTHFSARKDTRGWDIGALLERRFTSRLAAGLGRFGILELV
jgi:hypothetical protein